MELIGNKIEFDLEELTPLLIGDKQEGFRQIGEKLLNAVLEKKIEKKRQKFRITINQRRRMNLKKKRERHPLLLMYRSR